MLTRPVQDNRMLRATADLRVGLGPAMSELSKTPGWYALARKQSAITRAAESVQGERIQIGDDFIAEMTALGAEYSLADPADKPAIRERLDQLKVRHNAELSAETQRRIDDGSMATPEDLNAEYGEWGLSFDRPMAREEARLIYEGKKAEVIRNAIVGRSPQGVLPTVARFGAGMAAMAADPLELASMFIPVVGEARMAALVARHGRVGGRVIAGGVEGLVGSALTEPFYYGLSRDMQLDYTMSDALLNVGLGAILGGGLGAAGGVAARIGESQRRVEVESAGVAARIGESQRRVEVESAGVALRQFATDQFIDISRFLDGRDLRSTTIISRSSGVEFQPAFQLPRKIAQDIRPIFTSVDAGGKRIVFDTIQKADRFAEKVGGESLRTENGYIVRQPSSAEIIRNPHGKPLTFKTERAAKKFIASAREIPEGTEPIKIGGRFGLVVGSDDVQTKALLQPDTVIPDGVNTRQIAGLPDASNRLSAAARSVLAEREIASGIARHAQNPATDPMADLEASRRFETADVSEPEREIAEYDAMVSQINEADLTPEARAELAEIKEIESHANDYANAAEAAAACIARS